MKLSDLARPNLIIDMPACSKEAALRRLADAAAGDLRVQNGDALFQGLLHRESQASTGIGMGLAIPHAKIPEVNDNILVIGRAQGGIDYEAMDGAPVKLLFMIGASDRQTREFVRLLAAVTHVLKNGELREKLLAAVIPDEFMALLRENDS